MAACSISEQWTDPDRWLAAVAIEDVGASPPSSRAACRLRGVANAAGSCASWPAGAAGQGRCGGVLRRQAGIARPAAACRWWRCARKQGNLRQPQLQRTDREPAPVVKAIRHLHQPRRREAAAPAPAQRHDHACSSRSNPFKRTKFLQQGRTVTLPLASKNTAVLARRRPAPGPKRFAAAPQNHCRRRVLLLAEPAAPRKRLAAPPCLPPAARPAASAARP